VNNIDLRRRISLISMLVAVVSGSVSLYFLFTASSQNKTLFIISVIALLIGFGIDRRVGKLDDRNAR
jgi:hypothetical protein